MAKIKKYILRLAMQGKLVEQDPNDEPASELLKRFDEEKHKLIKEKKIQKAKLLQPIFEDEFPYELPTGWKWVKLGEVSENIQYGHTASATTENTGVKFVRITDIQDSKVIWGNVPYCQIDEKKLSGSILSNNDILIARTGGTIGKSFVVENIEQKAVFASYLIRVKIYQGGFPKYIKLFLESDLYWSQLESKSQGTGQPNVNATSLSNLILPLPPISEQRRIYNKVRELFKQCNELSSKFVKKQTTSAMLNNSIFTRLQDHSNPEQMRDLRFVIENMEQLCNDEESIDQLRNAILSLAVQGKLVEQDVNDESASVLVGKVKKEKEIMIAEKISKKEKPLSSITEGEIPYELPQGWEWVRLGNLSKVIEYGTSQKATEINVGVPVLRMNNIQEGRVIYENLKYVETSIKDLPRLYLKYGDIAFNRTNSYELVGKSGCYLEEDDAYTFASYLIRISLFTEYLIPEYINYYLNSPVCRITQIEPQITQQNGQANFNGTKLKGVLIALPPKKEQKRIVQRLNSLQRICDDLEKTLISKEKSRDILMNVVGKSENN
ncbi:restriction endonuclease subunit S [Bacillus sp. Cr_A10]|uniref:restriction endonuclease subunit S n=1 Tax=Bacillus sp. Cr_A10 TaxID=3033993 RepID=UPI0023DB4795|nr:restriction endonuclease subunit S [Bacillus sp. Cr_A10]MDF2065098.1 restriction endonuclease subunit S [Bacillus sp. Cr_A10]